MSNNNIVIREIEARDNKQIELVISDCFPEFDLPLIGTAYEDAETSCMFESYQTDDSIYFVIESGDLILGGAGIKPLKNHEVDVCELQKMYFSPKIRGKGYGKKLFKHCLDNAKTIGFKQCYLESASQLKAAIHVYESFGFKHLRQSLGETGHYSCGVWMIRDLVNDNQYR